MKRLAPIGLFALSLALALYALHLVTPIVGDYFSFFRPTALAFLRGESNLYDAGSSGYFNAPWALAIWLPFVAFPYLVGQSAHVLAYLGCILVSVALLRKGVPGIGVLASLFNLPMFVVLMAAGIDPFVLLGVTLAYIAIHRHHVGLGSVALFVLLAKPQSVLIIMSLLVYFLRSWKVFVFPSLAAFGSALFIGIDWPLRYFYYLQANPPLSEPRVELWRFVPAVPLILLGLASLAVLVFLVRRKSPDDLIFAFALTTGFVFAPYALWPHFVALTPAFFVIARRSLRLALPVYISLWLLPWFGMAYPLALFAALGFVIVHDNLRAVHIPRGQTEHRIERPGKSLLVNRDPR